MNRPSTAKEALIAEALGDMATLLERIEKLGPVMDISHRQLVQISKDLIREVSMFETRMTDFSFKAALNKPWISTNLAGRFRHAGLGRRITHSEAT